MKRQGSNIISPCTRKPMKTDVFPALHVLSNVEKMIRAGLYDGELVKTWTKRMKMKKDVEDAEKKSKEGDVEAMRSLGDWYKDGVNELPRDEGKATYWHNKAMVTEVKGLADGGNVDAMFDYARMVFRGVMGIDKDDGEAYRWFKKAADAGCATSLVVIGHYYNIHGTTCGMSTNVNSGLALIASAARDGSDFACYLLGKFFYKSLHGIEKDNQQAKKWLKLAVGDGEQTLKQRTLCESSPFITEARAWLREIDDDGGGDDGAEAEADEEGEVLLLEDE